ncbi:hypothetical protein EAC14_11895 [Enterococcus faecium]|nr:hypothetical protein [Enterococcus faecium]
MFSGCAFNAPEGNNQNFNYIEKGLNELLNEDYEKAKVYFEMHLEENSDDKKVDSLYKQTNLYIETLALLNDDALEEAKVKAEEVIDTEGASEGLQKKAEKLITQINTEIKGLEDSQNNYVFEDFKGYYGHFSPEDPSKVDVLITISDSYFTTHLWMSDYDLVEITAYTIDDNKLNIEFYQAADGINVLEETRGTLQVALNEKDSISKKLIVGTNDEYNSLTKQQAFEYGFLIKDFLIDDM